MIVNDERKQEYGRNAFRPRLAKSRRAYAPSQNGVNRATEAIYTF